MCSIAAASLGATIFGTVFSAVGASQQASAQASQMNYQAAVARNNEIISNRLADDAIKRGQVEEENHRRKVNQIKGDQRVGFAARNIDLGSDTVIETLQDTAMLGELDALTIRNNSEREAYGFRTQGMNYAASATNLNLGASNASSAGRMNAFTTLLSGASTVGKTYAEYDRQGVKMW